jgi:hypothetical protein
MRDTVNGAALLATARDFQSRIIAQREAIETSRRLPEDLARDLEHVLRRSPLQEIIAPTEQDPSTPSKTRVTMGPVAASARVIGLILSAKRLLALTP